jgi:hypothetical protein
MSGTYQKIEIRMNDKQIIQSKLDELKNQIDIQKRFYHFRSIQNFIYFFDKLKSSERKEKAFFTLNEYLDIVKSEPIEDINQCIFLYTKYIKPIGSLYEDEFNFMPAISFRTVLFLVIIFYGVFYLFNLPVVFYVFIGIILFGYYFYFLKKKLQKRVYGLKW